MARKSRSKSTHFVDNSVLLSHFVEYRAQPEVQGFLARKAEYRRLKQAGLRPEKFIEQAPRIPDFVFMAIYLIANNYARKPNWKHLSYLDEMICDAIAFCCKYAYNFDPTKTDKPFSYLTMGVHRAFLMRIAREKHEAKIAREFVRRAATGQDPSYCGESSLGATTHASLLMKHVDDVESLSLQTYTTKSKPKKKIVPQNDGVMSILGI